jgi:hypothetical protein
MDGYCSNDSPAQESEMSQGGASPPETPTEKKPTHSLPAPPSPSAKRRFIACAKLILYRYIIIDIYFSFAL